MNYSPRDERQGIFSALGAYVLWGLFPIFFKQMEDIPSPEIVAHRILWTMLLVGCLLIATGQLGSVMQAARQRKVLAGAFGTAALIMTNWLTFIWAVNAGRILETSLGYFASPLFTIALGVLVLKERLTGRQWVAVGLAAVGVMLEGWRLGSLPWISLVLAATFGGYGLLRKQLPLDAQGGLMLETLLMTPVVLGYLLWLGGDGTFGTSVSTSLWLISCGLVTAIPLLLFAFSARRLPLATLGFLQYLTPSLSFLVAILIYGETLNLMRLMAFSSIWIALALYSLDLLATRHHHAH